MQTISAAAAANLAESGHLKDLLQRKLAKCHTNTITLCSSLSYNDGNDSKIIEITVEYC